MSSLGSLERLVKALADSTRLRILALLVHGEVCVCHIHDALQLPQPTVSRHLAYLRRSGLVSTRREGTWIYYRLARLDEEELRAVAEAVGLALRHRAPTPQDAARLQRRLECC